MAGKIYSIGHGGRDVQSLIEAMTSVDAGFLIDVRSQPYSKYQPDFNREALTKAMHGRFRYVFMGDALGGRPQAPDCYIDGVLSYGKVMQQGFFLQGLARLQDAHIQGITICMMCSEGKPDRCHRTHLLGRALAECEIEVQHIHPSGSLISHGDLIASGVRPKPPKSAKRG